MRFKVVCSLVKRSISSDSVLEWLWDADQSHET